MFTKVDGPLLVEGSYSLRGPERRCNSQLCTDVPRGFASPQGFPVCEFTSRVHDSGTRAETRVLTQRSNAAGSVLCLVMPLPVKTLGYASN